MSRAEVRNLVIATLAVHLNASEQRVTEDAELFDDLGADSLDVVELTLQFEEMFKVEITDDDLEQTKTVGQVIDLIDKKVNENMGEENQTPRLPNESDEDYEARVQQLKDNEAAAADNEDEGDGDEPEADEQED
jgi:acyl carrier protein